MQLTKTSVKTKGRETQPVFREEDTEVFPGRDVIGKADCGGHHYEGCSGRRSAFLTREGVADINENFSGRYEVEKVIYETQDTAVYLARHRTLSEYRIIKRIKKSETLSAAMGGRHEAEILKDLRHPGIPVLYDYEESEDEIFLVEEFVRGVALSDYLDLRDSISMEQICSFLVQICEIIAYLHRREPFPILYQDLKPEHLYLRGEQLMLIDYGAALYVPRSGTTFQKYGTRGYCAPEIVANGTTSVRADIYSVGCVAEFLLAHTKERIPIRVRRLVRWACRTEPEERPPSAEIYLREWEQVLARYPASETETSCATVVVAGTTPACGTTHIAIALVVYLNSVGRKAYFIDRTEGRTTQRLARSGWGFYERDMVIYHHHFRALLCTGAAVEGPKLPDDGMLIVDAGCDFAVTKDADRTICVAGSRPWQDDRVDLGILPEDAVFVVNPANRFAGSRLARESGKALFGFPVDPDPFTLSRKKKELFRKLMAKMDL